MAEEQQAAEAPPAWFQQYTAELGGVLQQQNHQIQSIAQRIEGRAAAQAQPPRPTQAGPSQAEIDASLLNNLANNPTRVFAEVIGTADQRAEAKVNERVNQAMMELEQRRQAEQFWGAFYAVNPDMQMWSAEVQAAFNASPHPDPSARANAARDLVRQKMQAVQQAQADAQRQQQMSRRGMAGAPGMGYGAPNPGAPEPADEGQRTAQAIAEREAWKSQRRGNQLRNDAEYHDQMRQIKLQRIRDKARAA